MLKRLQLFMSSSLVYDAIFSAEDQKISELNLSLDDLLAQLSISTATWGLDYYEHGFGYKSDDTYEIRRALLKSKLRRSGKFDSGMVKSVALAYKNGEVDVRFANSTINIDYVGIGVPEGYIFFEKIIEEIKPAHIAVIFNFLYRSHSQLASFTNSYLALYTHDQIRSAASL